MARKMIEADRADRRQIMKARWSGRDEPQPFAFWYKDVVRLSIYHINCLVLSKPHDSCFLKAC